jgi:DNA-binding transcriptional MocR family regulator
MSVRDLRQKGWCWQDKRTLRLLREYYDGERLKRRSTALALYVVLTEVASNQYNPSRAEATHRALWEMTGTSEATVKRYLQEFEALGLVAVERRKLEGDINLPNVYTLLTPGVTDEPTPVIGEGTPGVASEPSPVANGHQQEESTINNQVEGTGQQNPFVNWRRSVNRHQ